MKQHPFHYQQPHCYSRLRFHVSSHYTPWFSGDNIIRASINTEFWLHLGNAPATYTYTISQSHADLFFHVLLSLVGIMNSCQPQRAGHFLTSTPHKLPQIYRPESHSIKYTIYVGTLFAFVLLQLPVIYASNTSMLLAFRFITGLVGSPKYDYPENIV